MTVSRWIGDTPWLPQFTRMSTLSGNCDDLQNYEMYLPAISLNKSTHTIACTGRYDRNTYEGAFTNISKIPWHSQTMTVRFASGSSFAIRDLHLENHDNSEFMSGGARIVHEEGRVVPGKACLGVKHRKTSDIDPGFCTRPTDSARCSIAQLKRRAQG